MPKLLILLTLLCVVLSVQAQDSNPDYRVEPVLERPFITSVIWAPDGRMFWTEKNGILGVASPEGQIQQAPVLELEVQTFNEQGLLSIALDPAFEENHFFYVFYTAPFSVNNTQPANLIVRYTEQDGLGINPIQLFRIDVPVYDPDEAENAQSNHNGGRLRFGPDGFLYVSIGDLGNRSVAQDINNVGGKIHRFVVAGNQLVAAPGNPYVGNSVWALGLRNTFSFAFDPFSGHMFATENGPECDDEINLIVAGQNYGWIADVDCNDPPAVRQAAGARPLISWSPTIAPTGIMIYDGEAFPGWQGQLFYCAFKIGELRRVQLNEARTQFAGDPVLITAPHEQRCAIELAQGPDGYIYYSNSNGLYRLTPPNI